MNTILVPSKKELQRRILTRLQNSVKNSGSKIIRSESVVFSTADETIFYGYSIEIFKKYEDYLINGTLNIYFRDFEDLDEKISETAPYQTYPLKKWEMPVVCRNFQSLADTWPADGLCLGESWDLEGAQRTIDEFSISYAEPFFKRYATVSGLLDYLLETGPKSPGNWRITLEFVLRERLYGRANACEYIAGLKLSRPTAYESHQMNWISMNRCVQSN